MKFTLKITEVKSIGEIPGYWSDNDCIHVLEELDFPDARSSNPSELRELLEMAISDLEPHESAGVLLRYKLNKRLNDGQIKNLSHEMADGNEAEGNPDMALHYDLFGINQLLYAAFNGIFPNAKATKIDFELSFEGDPKTIVTKEIALKAVCSSLTDKSPILRLFGNQLNGKAPFGDAEKIVWELHTSGLNKYTMITSDYWINREDFKEREISRSVEFYEDREEG